MIGAHKRNLELYTDGFPISDSVTDSLDPVKLTESEETIRLMMQFCHNQRRPSVVDLSIRTVVDLAEAAEKYLIDAAVDACSTALFYRAKEMPLSILRYAVVFNHPKIADEAAPFTIAYTMAEVDKVCRSNEIALLWFRYRERYRPVIDALFTKPTAVSYPSERSLAIHRTCTSAASKYFPQTMSHFRRTTRGVYQLILEKKLPGQEKFDDQHAELLSNCTGRHSCSALAGQWFKDISYALAEVPKFSSLMG
ncbi:hypothetical protein CC2G_008267 [Coprinopsis cinerea AmutBmut pab1-1]|nr:hypothetical protein CC2G_008267 [Coprinopsis cinerea AmutBmut pab1-1]